MGITEKKLYKRWLTIKYRCSPTNKEHKTRYYDRGIRVCEEWEHNYLKFKIWALNNGYDDDLTIDRIDVNKGYSAENCRWITKSQNSSFANRVKIIATNLKTGEQTLFDSMTAASKYVNGDKSAISRCCSGLRKSHCGFSFRIADKERDDDNKNS